MRVLFLEYHPMWIHGLPNGFRDLGHEVKISGKLTKHQMTQMITGFKPDLIITLGWTLQHRPHRRPWIRRYVGKSKVPHVFWATEDPTHFRTFSQRYVRATKPDFVFTICQANVSKYERLGFPSAHMDFGYHYKVHRRSKPYKQFRSEIAVVANGYSHILKKYPKHYRIQSLHTLIRPLVQNKVRIDFWGRQWDKMKPILGTSVPKSHMHGYLAYPEARKVYNSAKIVIGPQNQLTQVTQRTYEILGSGGFLLTSDTPEIRRLFEPGKHLVVSRSEKETKRLVSYYLKHPQERKRIREEGFRAVTKHSYQARASYMLQVLIERGILTGSQDASDHIQTDNSE